MFPILLAIVPVVVCGVVAVGTVLIVRYYYYKKVIKRGIVTLLDPRVKCSLPIIGKEEISHDTRRFRFGLPSKNHKFGVPVGQHIYLTALVDGEYVVRPYTPVSSDSDKGFMDLVVKVYFKNVHPKFPEGGKMSQHLDNMKIGNTVSVQGPAGSLLYLGSGKFSINVSGKDSAQEFIVMNVAMICGGTDITPMLPLIRQIIKDPNDHTKMALLFANNTEKDILLQNELEEVRDKYSDQFKLWYTLSSPPEGWQYRMGRISSGMIQEHLSPPSPDTMVLICGPPLMISEACIPNLDKLNYDKELRFVY